jgi:transposase
MDQRVRRSRYDYTLTFKLGVVARIESGELTCRQAQQEFGIQGASTVANWVRKHGQGKPRRASLDIAKWKMPMGKPRSLLTPEQQRIKELESQLQLAQEKASLFEAVLDVLKKDYGVVPVKKPSGKSSRKSSSRA